MKLIRFGKVGKEKPGVLLEDGARLDVPAFGSDYNEEREKKAQLALTFCPSSITGTRK